MPDRSGLRFVGFIFASVTFAVMLTTTMVVWGYSDGVYSLESTAIEGTREYGLSAGGLLQSISSGRPVALFLREANALVRPSYSRRASALRPSGVPS